jgi:hypothetical protein
MTHRRPRGRPIKVNPAWLDEISAYKSRTGKTLKQLGEELAPLLGAKRPVNPTSVFEYTQGKSVTQEMTEAFATLMGVPVPDFEDQVDPELDEWTELGRLLRAETPDKFRRELAALRELVAALSAHATRR